MTEEQRDIQEMMMIPGGAKPSNLLPPIDQKNQKTELVNSMINNRMGGSGIGTMFPSQRQNQAID